jgi:DNA processing protein
LKDLEYVMNWAAGQDNCATKPGSSLGIYEAEEQTVLTILIENSGKMMIDEISWRSSLPVSQLASILLGLEFKGAIASMPGKIYKLAKTFQ